MNYKTILIVVAALTAAFSIGRFSAPKKIETREIERVVYRENENINRNQNLIEVITETRLPDGTIIKETRKEKETSTQTERQRDSSSETIKSTSIQTRPSFRVGALYEPSIEGFQEDSYSLIVEKRIVSELYMGISVSSNKTVGITVSLGF